MEADTGNAWSGIETDKLCQWISEHIGELALLRSAELASEPSDLGNLAPVNVSATKLKITQFRLFQPPGAPLPIYQAEIDNTLEGLIKGNKPFQGEIGFTLTGPDAAEIVHQQSICILQAFVYELTSGKSTALGEPVTLSLKDREFDYSASLPPFSLKPGKYRFWVMLTPQKSLAVPDFLEIPVLNII
jgi:hypothetical protein